MFLGGMYYSAMNPPLRSLAKVKASILSVFTLAWAMTLVLAGFESITSCLSDGSW